MAAVPSVAIFYELTGEMVEEDNKKLGAIC